MEVSRLPNNNALIVLERAELPDMSINVRVRNAAEEAFINYEFFGKNIPEDALIRLRGGHAQSLIDNYQRALLLHAVKSRQEFQKLAEDILQGASHEPDKLELLKCCLSYEIEGDKATITLSTEHSPVAGEVKEAKVEFQIYDNPTILELSGNQALDPIIGGSKERCERLLEEEALAGKSPYELISELLGSVDDARDSSSSSVISFAGYAANGSENEGNNGGSSSAGRSDLNAEALKGRASVNTTDSISAWIDGVKSYNEADSQINISSSSTVNEDYGASSEASYTNNLTTSTGQGLASTSDLGSSDDISEGDISEDDQDSVPYQTLRSESSGAGSNNSEEVKRPLLQGSSSSSNTQSEGNGSESQVSFNIDDPSSVPSFNQQPSSARSLRHTSLQFGKFRDDKEFKVQLGQKELVSKGLSGEGAHVAALKALIEEAYKAVPADQQDKITAWAFYGTPRVVDGEWTPGYIEFMFSAGKPQKVHLDKLSTHENIKNWIDKARQGNPTPSQKRWADDLEYMVDQYKDIPASKLGIFFIWACLLADNRYVLANGYNGEFNLSELKNPEALLDRLKDIHHPQKPKKRTPPDKQNSNSPSAPGGPHIQLHHVPKDNAPNSANGSSVRSQSSTRSQSNGSTGGGS